MYNAYLPKKAIPVTPSDTVQTFYNGFMVSATGAVAIQCEDGSDMVFPYVAAGQQIMMRLTQILATGTTATGIIGFL